MTTKAIKALPWLLILFGILALDKFKGFVSVPLIVLGIVILIERKWPEKWGEKS